MIRTLLLTVIAAMTISFGHAQKNLKMKENKIKIRNNQVEINYYQQGKGNTTLLFLHGWCINKSYWNNQLNFFSNEYTTLAMDLPGFGKSTAFRQNWTIEEYAEDVNALIDSLHLQYVVLIGHSMSGEIMIQTAMLNNPNIIGLIGVDNFKALDVEYTPEQMKQMTDFFPLLQNDFKNSAPMYADMMLFHPMTSTEIKDRVKTDFANSNAQAGYESLMNYIQFSITEAQILEKLNFTLNLIHCDYYPTNENGLKNHCKKGYKIDLIANSGHYPMIEKPNEFNSVLEKILSSGVK
jgi:pimeloyl-ACP methyl ester carboxylesterase